MSEYDTYPAWVCICCFVALVNGEPCQCGEDESDDADKVLEYRRAHPHDHMRLMENDQPTPGMLDDRHMFGCLGLEGCDCETLSFSWQSCDGCGTRLGGERHAVIGWIKKG